MKNLHSTITSKGQVTIPTVVRNKMNLSMGVKLEFIICDDYVMLVPINKSIRTLQGILPKPKNSLSCDEMNNVIRESYDRN
jgi:AbrB family looped-hinge helix DNA binding protein